MPPYVAWPTAFNIAPAKMTRYLLDPRGGSPGKARWWLSQGFSADAPDAMFAALFQHTSALNFVGIRVPVRSWGHRLVFEGPIRTPADTTPVIRSVWQVGYGTASGDRGIAELVTAHRV